METPPRFESRLCEADSITGETIGMVSAGRGQVARDFARSHPKIRCELWFPDAHFCRRAQQDDVTPPNLEFHLGPDWARDAYDGLLIALRRRDSAEWNRDVLQSAFQRLRVAGPMWVAIDSPQHPQLLNELREWPAKLVSRSNSDGLLIQLIKRGELKRIRNFEAEVVYRDAGRVLRLRTRPGVFGHRKLDAGARQILKAVEIDAGARVLDLGSGSGAIGIALAAREPTAQLVLVDSHARAVCCGQNSALANGLANVTCYQADELGELGLDPFDLVVANPPYFANFRIAERFVAAAAAALRPDGKLLLVTKSPGWYTKHAGQWLDEMDIWPSGDYSLVVGQPRAAGDTNR